MFILVLVVLVTFGNIEKTSASRTCHGNIIFLNPTGKKIGGVAASQADVIKDLPWLQRFRHCYQASADRNCIQASVLAAIASRCSRGGSILVRTGGYGDSGRTWGIMQCDLRASGLNCLACPWDSCCHIEMMTARLLIPNFREIRIKHPNWNQHMALQGAVAAYSVGVSNVQSWPGVDIGTPGNDYSNDIMARAIYLHSQGWN